MIKSIWNFIKGFKDWLDLIIKIVAVAGLITGFAGIKSCNKQKAEKNDAVKILTSQVESFKTKSGLNATKANSWKIKYKSLEKINDELSHENNAYLSELLKAKQIINDLDIRLKDAKNYISSELEVKDSVRTEVVFINCEKVEIKPIETDHLKIDFKQEDNILNLNYQYNAEISTIVYLEKDKDQFFLWRWFNPRWDHNSVTTIDDANANINNIVSLEFHR